MVPCSLETVSGIYNPSLPRRSATFRSVCAQKAIMDTVLWHFFISIKYFYYNKTGNLVYVAWNILIYLVYTQYICLVPLLNHVIMPRSFKIDKCFFANFSLYNVQINTFNLTFKENKYYHERKKTQTLAICFSSATKTAGISSAIVSLPQGNALMTTGKLISLCYSDWIRRTECLP